MKERTTATKTEGGWANDIGYVSPIKPGMGPNRTPAADFPTGPAVGEMLPNIRLPDQTGTLVDLHQARSGRPAVLVFNRSAVW